MNDFDSIALNTNWQVNGFNRLPHLSDWTQYFPAHDGVNELRQVFDLEPIGEVCLRFFLHIESAPDDTAVRMNGWDVGSVQAGQALGADVTDYVTLEDNVLLLIVNQRGTFGEVWLEPVPCEAV